MMVTVIITTYNGYQNIGRALESLCSQTYKDFEVIVVDDNGAKTKSQIMTSEVINRFVDRLNIKYCVHACNKNGAAARNTGIRIAKGEYIGFLDDDDVYLKDRLANAVDYLSRNTKIDAVFSNVLIQRNGKLIRLVTPTIRHDIKRDLLLETSMFGTGSNLFIRRAAIINIHGFDENYSRRQDNEFLLRLLKDHKYGVIKSIDIMKCNEGTTNLPSYEKMVASNDLYYKDFKEIIDSLSESDRNRFFEREYAWLFFCCMMNEDRSHVSKAKKDLEKYRKLNKKELCQFILSRLRVGHNNLLAITQPFMSKIKNSRMDRFLRKNLPVETILEIKKYNIV